MADGIVTPKNRRMGKNFRSLHKRSKIIRSHSSGEGMSAQPRMVRAMLAGF
ncbi:hypothetical protein [Ferrovibrio sp.]|uniref:hypothetical protein n=1 Tax=Ferrovibrio sp. TaxID=1917215 RepID=UPI0035AF5EB2